MTLMTAVATAGAAVSPSMGSMTRPGLRSVIALLNLRLGTWFPNPVSSTIRHEVATREDWWQPKHWWQTLLHNQDALRLKAALLFREDTVVIDVPQHARGQTRGAGPVEWSGVT